MENESGVFIGNKYFYLLLSLISYFLISPFLIFDQPQSFALGLVTSLLILFCVNVASENRYLLIISIILGTLSLGSAWAINFLNPHIVVYLLHFIINFIFLTNITAAVIYSVAKHKRVTHDTLFGAICGYLLLGLTWTFLYLIVATIDPNSFVGHKEPFLIHHRVQYYTYYSYITLTTVGYGDIFPTTNIARTLSWLEAVTGQAYLAVWISQLVGLRISQKNKIT